MSYLVYIACFILGWYARQWFAVLRLNYLLKEHNIDLPDFKEDLKSDISAPELKIKVEKHKDTFYIYDANTDKFLAQGATRTECVDKLTKEFPKFDIVADPNNTSEVGFK
jgi:hypothetical protein